MIEDNAISSFLDKCGETEEFRLAVKRTRPKTLQEAVTNAMQEESLRVGEKELVKDKKPFKSQVLGLDNGDHGDDEVATGTGEQRQPQLRCVSQGFPA